MILLWLGALVLFIVVEAVTVGLVSIWFAIGALAALISALLEAGLWIQIALFLAVSAAAMAATRPLVKKYVTPGRKRTNADRVMDMVGVVTERIDNIEGTGAVHVGGRLWMARSADGSTIEPGAEVCTERIEGVKLIVVPRPVAEESKEEKNA